MKKFSSSDEVYQELRKNLSHNELSAMLSFANYEIERISWAKEREEELGKPPTNGEIQKWYRERTQKFYEERIAISNEQLKGIEDSIRIKILEEEKAKSFWMNVLSGVVSSTIFSCLIYLGYTLVAGETDPVKLIDKGIKEVTGSNEKSK